MKRNMSQTDKTIRLVIATVIVLLYYFDIISGTLAVVLGALAIIFVLTSLINFCPLYTLLGINTCKVKS